MKQFDSADPAWKSLYKIGGVAALLAVFVFRRNLAAELGLLMNFGIVGGVPTTPLTSASDWFNLFQDNWLVGLTFMNFFDLVEYALLGLVFLALYGALRQANRSAMVIATTCRPGWDHGLLCLEPGICHACPQRALCGSDQRGAAIYIPGSRGSAAGDQQSRIQSTRAPGSM